MGREMGSEMGMNFSAEGGDKDARFYSEASRLSAELGPLEARGRLPDERGHINTYEKIFNELS